MRAELHTYMHTCILLVLAQNEYEQSTRLLARLFLSSRSTTLNIKKECTEIISRTLKININLRVINLLRGSREVEGLRNANEKDTRALTVKLLSNEGGGRSQLAIESFFYARRSRACQMDGIK